ncbi:MAG: SHOCT domain-containing protein [Solirubrobacteraceae bacterium]
MGQISVSGGRGGAWQCGYCRRKNRVTVFVRWPTASASARAQEQRQRGTTQPSADVKLIGGFTVVGGRGMALPPLSVCSVLTLLEVIHVTVEIGPASEILSIPYGEMTALEIEGGSKTTGTSFVGTGSGLAGALEGIIIASALNKVTQKTKVNTGLYIRSVKGEIILHHGEFMPSTVRQLLSPMWTNFDAAKRAGTVIAVSEDPVTLLRGLERLRTAGILTDEEFAAKKAEILSRI